MNYGMGSMKNMMKKGMPANSDIETDSMAVEEKMSPMTTNVDKIKKHLDMLRKSIELAMESEEIPMEKGAKLLDKVATLYTLEPESGLEEEEEVVESPNPKKKKALSISVGTVPLEGGSKGVPAM